MRRQRIVFAAALTMVGGIALMAQQPTAKRLAQRQTGRATTDIQSRVKTYSSLRTLNTAEATYWGGDPQKGYARSLERLGPKGVDFIEPILASGKKDGYSFILTPGPANASGFAAGYRIQ